MQTHMVAIVTLTDSLLKSAPSRYLEELLICVLHVS